MIPSNQKFTGGNTMDRHEAIELAFEIKENPNGHDFSDRKSVV